MLSCDFGLSRRQAYRYLEEAQAIGHLVGDAPPLRAGVLPRSTPGNNSPRSAITTAARRCRPRTPRSHRPAALPPRSGIGGRAGGSPGGPTDLSDRLRRAVAARREALPDVDGRSLSSCITGPAADTSVTSSVTSGCRPAAPRSCHSLAARSPYRQLFDGRLKPNWKSYRLGSRDSRRAASWWLRLRSGSSTVRPRLWFSGSRSPGCEQSERFKETTRKLGVDELEKR
jgi:hypothetical protein